MHLLPSSRSARPSRRSEPAIPGRPPAWQRRFRRHRRLAAAALSGVVVWSLGTTLHPPAPASRPVLVARHDLRPGVLLSADDVEIALRPPDSLAADAATSAAPVVGHVVAFPVRSGETLRERDVIGPSLLTALGPGTVATPVHLSDDAASVAVRTGDLVDLIAARGGDATGEASAEVVASRVRVLVVGGAAGGASGGSGLLGSPASTAIPASVLVLATTTAQALDIARASVGSRLSLTLRAG